MHVRPDNGARTRSPYKSMFSQAEYKKFRKFRSRRNFPMLSFKFWREYGREAHEPIHNFPPGHDVAVRARK